MSVMYIIEGQKNLCIKLKTNYYMSQCSLLDYSITRLLDYSITRLLDV